MNFRARLDYLVFGMNLYLTSVQCGLIQKTSISSAIKTERHFITNVEYNIDLFQLTKYRPPINIYKSIYWSEMAAWLCCETWYASASSKTPNGK